MIRLLSFLLMIVWASQGPALAQGSDIRMVFVGDVMLADGPGRVIRSGKDPFRHVAGALRDADITIGNLECVIASSGKPEPKQAEPFPPAASRCPLRASSNQVGASPVAPLPLRSPALALGRRAPPA